MTEDDLEIDVRQITVPDNSHSVFIATLPNPSADVVHRIQGAWDRLWQRAGTEVAPALLVIPRELTIDAVSDAALHKLGLMRMTQSEETP